MIRVLFRVKEDNNISAQFLYNDYNNVDVNTLLTLLNRESKDKFVALNIPDFSEQDIESYDRSSIDLLVRLRNKQLDIIICTEMSNIHQMRDILNVEVKDDTIKYEVMSVKGKLRNR